MIKRLFDIFSSFTLMIFLSPLMALTGIYIILTEGRPAVYWSKRVGQHNNIFNMPKFRSMKVKTPQLATHLFTDPDSYLIKGGKLLRKSSLDELPQLWSILVGKMSFVGPRPALFNQDDLIKLRTERGIHILKPGLTGLAQINGRDHIPLEKKVDFDYQYLKERSNMLDVKIIFMTVVQVLQRKSISH